MLTETRLGRPMDDALAEMADRVGSKNFAFVITAVTIQRQVGGIARRRCSTWSPTRSASGSSSRARSTALTAMGRMSAYVLIGLPFFIAIAITLLNPTYMAPALPHARPATC